MTENQASETMSLEEAAERYRTALQMAEKARQAREAAHKALEVALAVEIDAETRAGEAHTRLLTIAAQG